LAPRHHCTRPAQKGSPPDGPRTRQVAPADARSKVTGSSPAPGPAPTAPPAPDSGLRPSRQPPDRAATRTPGTTPPRGPRPPPFRCLSRDPKPPPTHPFPSSPVQRPSRHPRLRQAALLCRQTPRYSRNGSGQQAPFCRAAQY
jgi:hypothetical protein